MKLDTTWRLPPESFLPSPVLRDIPVENLSARLEAALERLGAPAKVVRTVAGPTTVAFELRPAANVKMNDFTRLRRADDLAFALSAEGVRIQAPIPGKQLVGIEIPSPARRVVELSELLPVTEAPLTAGIGITPGLSKLALDIAELPHLLVAGATGSGKSSLLHTIICSLLMKSTPDELQLVLVDLKRTELSRYAGVPHLRGKPVDDSDKAMIALQALVREVERREGLLAKLGVQNIDEYNALAEEPLPRVLCVVDEFAELMLTARKDVETDVVRLGQLGRACGVHLLLATQSPHRQVFSGLIKANIPVRIALRVASGTHSRVALDQGGAEQLLGNGDALLLDGPTPRRFQAAYVTADVIAQIVEHWKEQKPEELAPIGPPVTPASVRPPTPPAPRRSRRSGLGVLIGLLALGALYVAFSAAPSPGGCPNGTAYENTSLEEVCSTTSGKVKCDISAYGYSPNRRRGPDGPWCKNAHGWKE